MILVTPKWSENEGSLPILPAELVIQNWLNLARRFDQWRIVWHGRASPSKGPGIWLLGADGSRSLLKETIPTQWFDVLSTSWSELKGRTFRFPPAKEEQKSELCVLG